MAIVLIPKLTGKHVCWPARFDSIKLKLVVPFVSTLYARHSDFGARTVCFVPVLLFAAVCNPVLPLEFVIYMLHGERQGAVRSGFGGGGGGRRRPERDRDGRVPHDFVLLRHRAPLYGFLSRARRRRQG